jgi:hypothetical protein
MSMKRSSLRILQIYEIYWTVDDAGRRRRRAKSAWSFARGVLARAALLLSATVCLIYVGITVFTLLARVAIHP